jgi:hypothetical protein
MEIPPAGALARSFERATKITIEVTRRYRSSRAHFSTASGLDRLARTGAV